MTNVRARRVGLGRIAFSALIVLLAVGALVGPLLYRAWRAAADRGGQQPAEPFRIAGNFYFVGANDVSIFLLTGPEGHILLDGGYPAMPPMIVASMAKLGFDIKDVKVLLNSLPRGDHAAGLAELQRASGATLWASQASAHVLASGGDDPVMALPLRGLIWSGVLRYQPPRVDRRLKDGEVVRVGPIAVTAHVTPGSAPGCTSWSFPVQDGDRTLQVVSACPLGIAVGLRYPEQRADIARSIEVLRRLRADVWVTSRGRGWGRYRKFAASRTLARPADAFVDPQGYRAYLDAAERDLREGVEH